MHDIYTRLVAKCLFPFHERLKGHDTVQRRKALEASQWWPVDRLESHRVLGLRRLLTHAGQHVPYYRRLFATAGFDPAKLQKTGDIERLPFLTKDLVRANLDALKSSRAEKLLRFNTGGSSGEPLIFYVGTERVSHDVAAKWRATRWWGVDIGDPEIVVWGSPIEIGAQDRARYVRDRILRTRLLPAFEMSERNLDRFVAQIRRSRPRMLFGYPSALAHIAAHAERRGESLSSLGIKVAFVTSERLYDHQRLQIERSFGCRVANGYGGRDAGFIAHECPSGGLHVMAEDVIVEIVDPDGRVVAPGEAGEIAVTHLATRDFPFVRYRTGDVGSIEATACPCGRGLPLLKEVHGRSTDFVVAQDGTVLHGLALIYVLRDLPGIRQFKIVQETLDSVRVELIAEGALDRRIVHMIESGFRARLGPTVNVAVEPVQSIAPERSGKFRYVASRVDPSARSTPKRHGRVQLGAKATCK
ncbi:MAG: AMP-binding protein [Burkholderiales bacterium]|nr:AMP-binding protein [Burkholderiales bacterium]